MKMLIWLGMVSLIRASEVDLVWELNRDNYESALAYQSRILVFFYGSECSECKLTSLELSTAAEKLNEEAIRVARVNCDSELEVCSRYNVSKLPHFWYFIDGQPLAYTGPLLSTGLSKWVLARQKLIYRVLETNVSLNDLTQNSRMTIVSIGEITEELRNTLQQVSLNYNYIQFFETNHQSHIEELGMDSGLALFKGDLIIKFTGQITEKNLKELLDQHKPTRIYEFNEESIKLIFENKSTTIFFFRSESDRKNQLKNIEKLSDSYGKDFLFVATDLSHKGKNANRLSSALGITPEDQPIVVILDFKPEFTKYRVKYSTAEDLTSFIQDYLQGKSKPYYKSQPIGQEFTSEEKLVRVIVGLTHEEFVTNPQKDVLMLYCTEKHPNCTEFFKVYEKLAIVYRQYQDFDIGTMDIVFNEAKGLNIPDIPLLVLYTKENKEGAKYFGDLSMISVLRFITDKLPSKRQEL